MATYDLYINCAQDWRPNIDVERQAAADGEYEAYSGVSGVTGALYASERDADPIPGFTSIAFTERSGYPGRIAPATAVDVATLQSDLLPNYEGRVVFLRLTKSGELAGETFRCYVGRSRLRAP